MWLLIVLVAALILAFTIQGFRVGLLRRLVEFAGAIGSFILATGQGPALAAHLQRWPGIPARPALYTAWIVLFVLGLIATRLIAAAAGRVVQVSFVGWLDRAGGAVCGLLAGVLVASVILVGVSRLPHCSAVRDEFCARPATRLIYRAAPNLYQAFRRLGGDRHRVWEEIAAPADPRTARDGATAPTAPAPDSGARG